MLQLRVDVAAEGMIMSSATVHCACMAACFTIATIQSSCMGILVLLQQLQNHHVKKEGNMVCSNV